MSTALVLLLLNSIANANIPDIQLQIIKVPGGELSRKSLPDPSVKVDQTPIDEKRFLELKNLTDSFNQTGDPMISEIFGPLFKDRKFSIPIIATSGLPDPYDAWTAKYQGVHSIFFNLSIWNASKMNRSGTGVIRHEITHVLLKPLLRKPAPTHWNASLDHIVINEGIAHFIGYPDRLDLLNQKSEHWRVSEEELLKAQSTFRDPKVPKTQKVELLKKSNTGSFWNKYGAISGMFRAASLYRSRGAKGLIDAISKSKLEKQ